MDQASSISGSPHGNRAMRSGARPRAACPDWLLVTEHRPLVVRVVRALGAYRQHADDLESEGLLGLIEASRRFDPAEGVKFATYATWWIAKRVRDAAAAQATIVHVPRHRVEMLLRMRDVEHELRATLRRPPTADEIAAKAGLTLSQVERYRRERARALSLDDPISDGATQRVIDTLVESGSPRADEIIIEDDCRRCIARLVPLLPERHRDVVVRRFGLDGRPPRTLAAIADDYGVSRERVHQLERQAIARLRELFDRAPRPCAEAVGAAH